ncbi:GRB2-associated-binding protein 3 [Hypomesus transpacificus]|uniref:GRB2-associated-binding protein 3 n=1 Tax=Hypomesus transpacificus TaxID=137520 RepID=UPI001F07944F|nr:GRB2-associated-binding protein 3 [Hypomesus transpacificus]
MSAGDEVCTGWLIKSPPEKKLKRFAWRKRWFVLRGGRMSGNPDVLEYYRNKTSRRPIRTIDLKECEVQLMQEQWLVRREFQNQHLFVVKTSSRVFYLVAKTEEEMKCWVYSISQICHCGPLDDGTVSESEEGFSQTPTSQQPSPATSFTGNHDRRATLNQSESSYPRDYLFLSQCKTGDRVSIRSDSFSNSERSLEQNSSDNTIEDSFSSPPCTDPCPSPFPLTGPCPSPFPLTGPGPSPFPLTGPGPSPFPLTGPGPSPFPLTGPGPSPFPLTGPGPSSFPLSGPCLSPFPLTGPCLSPFPHARTSEPPFSAPCAPTFLDRPFNFSSSSSSPPNLHRTPDVFQFDKLYSSPLSEVSVEGQTPPPLPPKPVHLSEATADEGAGGSLGAAGGLAAPLPRRISLSSLDYPRGDVEGSAVRNWNKRLSLNLSPFGGRQSYLDDSYVPMASPALCGGEAGSDGYLPMSPSSMSFTSSSMSTDSVSPLGLPAALAPPPVNRDLKPRRRARPPPLDLRGLSTIRECSHLPLSRTMTEPGRHLTAGVKDQDVSCSPIESRQLFLPSADTTAQLWGRRSNLDYLSLAFNPASPSPVQKKPLLADEYRVDYVQLDEKKTQALKYTQMEWKDVRQSKV